MASDADFANFVATVTADDPNWELMVNESNLKVWRKQMANSPVNSFKSSSIFADIEPEVLYDVLHDHYYRREWDNNMIEGSVVQQVDPFNEVGYYAAKLPFPLSNRDFCNHRAWRHFPDRNEWVIFNRSVVHQDCPERSGFVRGWSFLGGYFLRKRPEGGTTFMFYSQNDPRGWIPTSVVNWAATSLSLKTISEIHKSALKYPQWKAKNRPTWKPWLTGYDLSEEPYQRYKK